MKREGNKEIRAIYGATNNLLFPSYKNVVMLQGTNKIMLKRYKPFNLPTVEDSINLVHIHAQGIGIHCQKSLCRNVPDQSKL